MAELNRPWKVLSRFVEISSPWLTLIGEKLQDNQGKILEYWRVEKADAVVVLTIQQGKLVLPVPMYRPGLGKTTLDFPGGRIPPHQSPIDTVPQILERELGINKNQLVSINAINSSGWAINSSFSNQKLYGFVVELKSYFELNDDKVGAVYPISLEGITNLLNDLDCLQCRAVLLGWWLTFR